MVAGIPRENMEIAMLNTTLLMAAKRSTSSRPSCPPPAAFEEADWAQPRRSPQRVEGSFRHPIQRTADRLSTEVSDQPDTPAEAVQQAGQPSSRKAHPDAISQLAHTLRRTLVCPEGRKGVNVMAADGQTVSRTQVARLYARVHDVDRFIADIETGGVFVPTAQELPVGSTAMLYAMVPSRSRVMDFRVEVVARRSADGSRSGMPTGVKVRPFDEGRVVGILRRR